jgi:DNA repair protein RadD
MLELHDFQQHDVDRIRERFADGDQRVLYQLPTGGGKGVMLAHVAAGAAALGNSVVILGHRQEIVDQISDNLTDLGVEHGIIAAGYRETPDLAVQVASVATLIRRLDRLRSKISLLIVDEAHHSVANTWQKIIGEMPDVHLIGCTATPERLDGQGLSDVFESLVIGPTIRELIEAGYLAKFTAYAPGKDLELRHVRTRMGDYAVKQLSAEMSKEVIVGCAVEDYERLCPGTPAIVFCVDIQHSQLVAERFAAAGYRSAHVDGKTPKDERRRLIATLGSGELQVLCNCGLISEGLDVPNVGAVILLRPTKSLALYLQQIGCALRPAPGKERALILDHSGNTYRFGPADTPRAWSLDGREEHANGSGTPVVRRCKECGALNPVTAETCSECGAALFTPRPHIEVTAPALVEIGSPDSLRGMTYWEALEWAGSSEQRLRQVAMARGFKRGWVWHRMKEMREVRQMQETRVFW